MTDKEKILILAGLFHDIGKFHQRCIDSREYHQSIGSKLIDDLKDLVLPILGNSESNLDKLKELIKNHHNKNSNDSFVKILQKADYLSASQRVEFENDKELEDRWSHKYLCSIFSKIRLNSNDDVSPRYYKHEYLIKKNYNALIPKYKTEDEAKILSFKYNDYHWKEFLSDLKTILENYSDENDFDTLVNILLILFEKYLWCIPDFTGSSETDISLFNHLKDTTAFAHSLFLTKKDNNSDTNLNLIVGDIPGIQNYIFDVLNKKAAKLLRGRSIFIQILSRNFATVFLKQFGLTETNLIMLAGGKFYILAPDTPDFNTLIKNSLYIIENYLINTFHYELRFNYATQIFDYEKLLSGEISFGDIIEKANEELNENKKIIFSDKLFNMNNKNKFIFENDFMDNIDADSNKIKCAFTDKPILKGDEKLITIDEKKVYINKQALNEFIIGDRVIRNNTIIQMDVNNIDINPNEIYDLKDIKKITGANKILLNPDLDDLIHLKKDDLKLLKNTRFIEVANFVSKDKSQSVMNKDKSQSVMNKDKSQSVMDFEEMSKNNIGAEYLTLIKGDIDNLGLIMAYGLELDTNEKNYSGISRITTLSNNLKYFFSFFFNGFLKDKTIDFSDNSKNNLSEDSFVYTIFAGGDDMMLICPQSFALNLLNNFNNIFKDFVCDNPEIHITYSFTHFKHSTPVRLVADFSDGNQDMAKAKDIKFAEIEETINSKPDCFKDTQNKNSLFIFDSIIDNSDIENLIEYVENIVKWGIIKDKGQEVLSSGMIRNLLTITENIKEYREKNETRNLIWHPHLTYLVNRNLKDKSGNYKFSDSEFTEFIDSILSISKYESEMKIENLLYPALCSAVYKLRN